MPNKTLSLPDSPRKLVYRKLLSILTANANLKRAVRTWKLFDGASTEDDAAIAEGEMPCVRVLPFGQAASPETPTTQNSPLGVRVEVFTAGFNVDDLLDLWFAIEAALFPGDGTGTTLRALQSVWPRTVGVKLSVPAVAPNPPDLPSGVMCGVGSITVDMIVPK